MGKRIEAAGIRALRELFGGKLPSGLPLWTRKNIDRRLYAILMDNRPLKYREKDDESCSSPGDVTGTLPISASPADVPLAIPTLALTATETAVPPVRAAAKGPEKPAGKRTRKSSKRTGKRKRTTTGSSAAARKHSSGSRKSKSTHPRIRSMTWQNHVPNKLATRCPWKKRPPSVAAARPWPPAAARPELAALRESLKAQAQAKSPQSKAKIASELKKTAAKDKDKIPPTALRLINPTYRGMDVIPEKIADGLKKNPRL